jgi:hypothetical protein
MMLASSTKHEGADHGNQEYSRCKKDRNEIKTKQ